LNSANSNSFRRRSAQSGGGRVQRALEEGVAESSGHGADKVHNRDTARRSRNRQRAVSAYRRTRNAEIVGEAARFASSRDRGKAGRFAYMRGLAGGLF
jgi:hypothetical protein